MTPSNPVSPTYVIQIIIFMFISAGHLANVKNLDNYGPYTADFPSIEYCAGPKPRNVTLTSVELITLKNETMARVNITVLTQCHIEEIKIKVYLIEKNQKSVLFNYNIKDPCQHFAFATYIEKFLGANKCIVKKGEYITLMSFSNITRSFYGDSAFYGYFQTKSIVTSKQGNILCWFVDTVISKKL